MYNSMSQLPFIPYRIMVYLATQDETIWKLLAYNDYNALSKPDLTFQQKMELVWTPRQNKLQQDYGVFLTNLVEDAIPESKCIMKIYNFHVQPKELYSSNVVYAFDFLYGGNMSLVEYEGVPVSRGDLFVHKILEVLNGAEVGGVGKLSFIDDISRYTLSRSVVGDSKKFTGVQLFLCTIIGDVGKEEECVG